MRVTFNSIRDNSLLHMNRESSKLAKVQNEIASGQKITRANEDPLVAQKILSLQSANAKDTQFYRNAGYALDISRASYAAMDRVRETVDRSGEIAQSISGLTTPDAYRAYAEEVDGLIERAVSVVNQQFDGKNLFGGTQTDTPPFNVTRDGAGQATAIAYTGAAKGADYQISENTTVAPFVDGPTNTTTADFIGRLIGLRDALLAGDASAITAARPGLRTSENDVLNNLGRMTAQQNHLETTQDAISLRFDQATARINQYNDVDLSTAIVNLTKSETAYQASLQATAKISEHSLLDYI